MPLLHDRYFHHVFGPIAGQHVGIVDAPGNAGDVMIHVATRQLCDRFGVRWTAWSPDDSIDGLDRLLVFGGGNMGTDYEEGRRIRTNAIETGLPCDLMPQSWRSPESQPFARQFARDHYSLGIAPPGTMLAPDLALGYETSTTPSLALFDREFLLRRDSESAWIDWPSHDPTLYCSTPEAYIEYAARYREIITDRLHFAIAGLLARRRVTLLPDRYAKCRGMWLTWLQLLGCQWADDPAEVASRQD